MNDWIAGKPGQGPLLGGHRGPVPPVPPPPPLPPSPADLFVASLAGMISVSPTGGLVIKCGTSSIELAQSGITITSGAGATIKLEGPTVNINQGALEVT